MVLRKRQRQDDDKSGQMDLIYVVFPALMDRLVERLAALEHQHWETWVKNLMEKEKLGSERLKRWSEMMVPYEELPEPAKEEDRKWARRVLMEIAAELRLKQ